MMHQPRGWTSLGLLLQLGSAGAAWAADPDGPDTACISVAPERDAAAWLAALVLASRKADLDLQFSLADRCGAQQPSVAVGAERAVLVYGERTSEVPLSEDGDEAELRVVARAFADLAADATSDRVSLVDTDATLAVPASPPVEPWLRAVGTVLASPKTSPMLAGGGLEVGARWRSASLSVAVAVGRGLAAQPFTKSNCLEAQLSTDCSDSWVPSPVEAVGMVRVPWRPGRWLVRPGAGLGARTMLGVPRSLQRYTTGMSSFALAAEVDVGVMLDAHWAITAGWRGRWLATPTTMASDFGELLESPWQIGAQLAVEWTP